MRRLGCTFSLLQFTERDIDGCGCDDTETVQIAIASVPTIELARELADSRVLGLRWGYCSFDEERGALIQQAWSVQSSSVFELLHETSWFEIHAIPSYEA